MEWFSDNETLIQAALAGAILAYSFQIAMRAGVFTLAGVGFWAIGGYTTAYLVTEREWMTAPAILVGILVSGVIGLLLALVLGRLRSLYLAMATVAFVLLVQIVAINWEAVTGGAGGMFGIPVTVSTWQLLVIVAVISVALFFFERGARGRTIEAMRLDEQVAMSVGINVVRERDLIFVLSSMMAALSGGIAAMMFNTLAPEQAGFGLIVDTLMMVVIGGAAAWWGALVGAFIVTWLPEILRFTGDYRGIVEGADRGARRGLRAGGLRRPRAPGHRVHHRPPQAGRHAVRGRHRDGPARCQARPARGRASRGGRTMTAALLTLDDVKVHFGGVKAVDGISLDLEPGKLYGIVGPNGSGKTTLINAISRLRPSDRRRHHARRHPGVGDEAVPGRPPRRRPHVPGDPPAADADRARERPDGRRPQAGRREGERTQAARPDAR